MFCEVNILFSIDYCRGIIYAGADMLATDHAGNSFLSEILDHILVLGREGAIDFLVDAGISPADAEALVATRC